MQLIVLAFTAMVLTACGFGKTNVVDYIDVEFVGVETEGRAELHYRDIELMEDLFDTTDIYNLEVSEMEEALEFINDFNYSVVIEVSPDSGLSNGDEVTLTVSVPDDMDKVKGGKKTYKVEGLKEIETLTTAAVEAGLSGEFSGYDGNGYGYVVNNLPDPLDRLNFEFVDNENLSNGDQAEVRLTSSEDQVKSLGYILEDNFNPTIEVQGLEPATEVTTEDVEKYIIVNVNGFDGFGQARVENAFNGQLGHFDFTLENNGSLSNGDEVKIIVAPHNEEYFKSNGYKFADDYNATFKVEGLKETADEVTDIGNYEDLIRMINEAVNRRYKSDSYNSYDIKLQDYMYRQYTSDDDGSNILPATLVGVYTVHHQWRDDQPEESTVVIGFSNIELDEDGQADLRALQDYFDRFDDTYSLASVIQRYEAHDFEVVTDDVTPDSE